jgi:branched-subunit amino acid aminotransferase/4-amino-4-deoxychorismate lyase
MAQTLNMPFVWLNGNFVEEAAASIPLRDAGLLHGAGVFTTMRADGGRVFRLAQHLQRLRGSCEALFIPLPFNDDAMAAAVRVLLERNALADARLRLTATRGGATADPLYGTRVEPNAFLTAAPLERYPVEFYERGMTVRLVDDYKLNPYDVTAGHKTLNYFARLHALREAARLGAGEALWFDVHHYLQSGSVSNVFVVKDGELFTPPTPRELRDELAPGAVPYAKSSVLPGVTRAAVIELARAARVDVHLAGIDVRGLLDADEVFLTNSVMRVMPVCRIERKPIGADKPGPVTTMLAARFDELVRIEDGNA